MYRLSLCYVFLALFSLAHAQGGYEYNKPDRPFSGTGGPSRPAQGYPGSSQPQGPSGPAARPGGDYNSGTPSSPSYPGSFPAGPQSDYQPGQQQGTNPGHPGSTFPQSNGGYPGSSLQSTGKPGYPQKPGSSFSSRPSSGQGYPGQSGPTGSVHTPGSNGLSDEYSQGGSSPSDPGNNFQGGTFNKHPQGVQSGSGNQFGAQSDTGDYEGGDYSAIPGEPDIDYPIYTEIPQTSFSCDAQNYPGYYADIETRCQVFHVCHNNRTYDFLCPNGTIFSQEVFVCVWWNQFDCNSAPGLYDLNANLYDYSIKGSDSASGFPPQSDFSAQIPSYTGSQGTSANYPVSQGSSANYPGSQGPQGPSANYPGSQGTSVNYPGNKGPQGPAAGYPAAQGPSATYPGSHGPQTQPQSKFPGSQRPQGPSSSYPANQGYPGTNVQSSSTLNDSPVSSGPSYPGSQGSPSHPGSQGPSSYPGSQGSAPFPGGQRPGFQGGNQGYPSGKPNGPSFPTGTSTLRPGLPQSDTGFPNPHQPNREYLPPRN